MFEIQIYQFIYNYIYTHTHALIHILQVDIHAGFLYDAVMLYSHALQDALDQGYNLNNISQVARLIFNTTFTGKQFYTYIYIYIYNMP